MNRRASLAAAATLAVARNTWGAQTALALSPDISERAQAYVEALARPMRETLAANILNRAFNQ